jgi:hypothetical protein
MGAGRWGKQGGPGRERAARAEGEATKGSRAAWVPDRAGEAVQAAADRRANARWDGSTDRLAAYGVS